MELKRGRGAGAKNVSEFRGLSLIGVEDYEVGVAEVRLCVWRDCESAVFARLGIDKDVNITCGARDTHPPRAIYVAIVGGALF